MYEQRNYVIFSTEELDKIDFSQVLETSAETVRKTLNKNKTFVKWDGDQPECVSSLTTVQGFYNHSEIVEILSGEDWTEKNNGPIS